LVSEPGITLARITPLAGACTEYQTEFTALGVIQQAGGAGSAEAPAQVLEEDNGIPNIKGMALHGKSFDAPFP
jgi:hypothetical protein